MIPLFMILTDRNCGPFALNVNRIESMFPLEAGGTQIKISVDEIMNSEYFVNESFDDIMATIQAASDGQYDKLSQTIVVKNK